MNTTRTIVFAGLLLFAAVAVGGAVPDADIVIVEAEACGSLMDGCGCPPPIGLPGKDPIIPIHC